MPLIVIQVPTQTKHRDIGAAHFVLDLHPRLEEGNILINQTNERFVLIICSKDLQTLKMCRPDIMMSLCKASLLRDT